MDYWRTERHVDRVMRTMQKDTQETLNPGTSGKDDTLNCHSDNMGKQ